MNRIFTLEEERLILSGILERFWNALQRGKTLEIRW